MSEQPSATPLDVRLAELVRAALAVYPGDAGSVTSDVEYVPRAGMYFTEVAPAKEEAAAVSLAFDGCWGGDTLNVTVGNTSFELFPFSERDLPYLAELLEATLAGRVEEVSRGTSSFARIQLANGHVKVGAMHLPFPWRTRRLRQYEAYGNAE